MRELTDHSTVSEVETNLYIITVIRIATLLVRRSVNGKQVSVVYSAVVVV